MFLPHDHGDVIVLIEDSNFHVYNKRTVPTCYYHISEPLAKKTVDLV